MSTVSHTADRRGELWARLAQVNDPELDEPVTDMGFVERAGVTQSGSVEVDFRLPTYWCSPNFAFLMLDGIRQALDALSWSPAYTIRLHDHMFAEEINRGIEAGKSFSLIFDELSGDQDLEALRATFRMKAFKRRQEATLLNLRRQGLTDRRILGMDLTSLDAVCAVDEEMEVQRARYREAVLERWPGRRGSDPAFVTWEGEEIAPEALGAYLAELRTLRINMEFNGALCRGLKTTRYKEMDVVDGEPTLVDFILDRVPPRECASRSARN
ncbi:iron-sulfur cluster assembly protein [Rhizobium hainanense]|uniref:MIP18 family-like domain-containing protein n=1 Tax=Rhizobium hainanense TaxID=52131 RepID=A0A1C3WJM8_9HYPH|nr:iron-sulfur cluster assembly protein [Rhizobium hainanense]SCB40159.1 protein of unknown function DUF59 [Rhizobium hainanense]